VAVVLVITATLSLLVTLAMAASLRHVDLIERRLGADGERLRFAPAHGAARRRLDLPS
jgi:hypothetical protein